MCVCIKLIIILGMVRLCVYVCVCACEYVCMLTNHCTCPMQLLKGYPADPCSSMVENHVGALALVVGSSVWIT